MGEDYKALLDKIRRARIATPRLPLTREYGLTWLRGKIAYSTWNPLRNTALMWKFAGRGVYTKSHLNEEGKSDDSS
jgi:hypothetical protein